MQVLQYNVTIFLLVEHLFYKNLVRGGAIVGKSVQNRSRQARWDSANLFTVSTHIPRREVAEWRMACAVDGRAPYAVLRDFVRQFVRDTLGPPPSMA